MSIEAIDIHEDGIPKEVLDILLKDNSSGRNIIWATNDYKYNGIGFEFESEITISKIGDLNIKKKGEGFSPRLSFKSSI